ncbi:hypothetical protein K438DRAFT_1777741 [Mycena galopus ATCC 62051]|nr:hypothetical protein K438DRAFT_1777741 [Mycena galopus ATCC 62051]
MFALCVAIVWATQEEQVALRSGGHRRITRGGPRNPWLKKLRQMTERVGTWLMKISRPQGEPGHEPGRRGTRTFAMTMRMEPGGREDSLPTRIHGDPPAAHSEASEVPELITDEDLEATPPYEERLSASARTQLDRVRTEMMQGSHQ